MFNIYICKGKYAEDTYAMKPYTYVNGYLRIYYTAYYIIHSHMSIL